MEIIRGIENFTKHYAHVVLTIGNFDGVHIGHQKIFRNVVQRAKAISGTPVALTFDPHPLKVIAPERGVRLITRFNEKARLMEQFGMHVMLCINFTRDFSHTDPDDFIQDIVVNRVHAREVIVGHRYAFGKGKKGGTLLLRRRSRKFGFTLRVIRNARLYGDVVSSSRIRSLVSRGHVCEASRLLGRPYMIEGTVIRGAGRGSGLLGIPTANLAAENELVPREGVYAVKVGLLNRQFNGVANIGRNPTFGENRMSYEVHIFDFSKNILSKEMKVYFIDRIRDEKKYPDAVTLQEHILKDIARAKEILMTKKYPGVI